MGFGVRKMFGKDHRLDSTMPFLGQRMEGRSILCELSLTQMARSSSDYFYKMSSSGIEYQSNYTSIPVHRIFVNNHPSTGDRGRVDGDLPVRERGDQLALRGRNRPEKTKQTCRRVECGFQLSRLRRFRLRWQARAGGGYVRWDGNRQGLSEDLGPVSDAGFKSVCQTSVKYRTTICADHVTVPLPRPMYTSPCHRVACQICGESTCRICGVSCRGSAECPFGCRATAAGTR